MPSARSQRQVLALAEFGSPFRVGHDGRPWICPAQQVLRDHLPKLHMDGPL